MRFEIDTITHAILTLLDGAQHKTRIVGGAVRNLILNMPVQDIDIATELLPDGVMGRCQSAGYKVIPTGIDHGTITVMADGRAFEITTLRQDVETTGRHAKVIFGTDWVEDAKRRDFTMNALYLNGDGTLYDPLNGLQDAQNRHVRFIGDANARIQEDYLRILRYFRFLAQYGIETADAMTLHAIAANIDGLAHLSAERVWSELKKILSAPNSFVLQDMAAVGVFQALGLGVPRRVASCNHEPLQSLFLLLIWLEEDAQRVADRLKLANLERNTLMLWAQHVWHMRAAPSIQQAREVLYHVGAAEFKIILTLAATRWHWEFTSEILNIPTSHPIPPKPFSAEAFMQRGLTGAALGAALKRAEVEWINAGFSTQK